MNIPQESIPSCGEASCELLVSPIPRPKPRPIHITVRPSERRVVMVDHHKPNSREIFRRAQQLLKQRGVQVQEEILQKHYASRPMETSMVEQLSQEKGLVLCGVSDCGSCSAGSAIDAVLLQQRGVAAIPVLTAPFRGVLERAMTYYTTDHDLPVVIIDHPTQNIDDSVLQQRALSLADQVERLLDG